jgi:hypothetical protein
MPGWQSRRTPFWEASVTRFFKPLLFAVAIAVAAAPLLRAAGTAPVQIDSASANVATHLLTIDGANFGTQPPTVIVDGIVLSIFSVVGVSYVDNLINTSRHTYSAASTSGPIAAAGSYTVGLCVQNQATTAASNNDYVNGWAMVPH